MQQIDLTKRSQAERLGIANSLIASVWEEYLNGSIDRSTLQVAAYIQANANRIVWKLNALNNSNTPNTLKAFDCIRRQEAIDLIEDIETKRLKGEIGLMYAPAIKGLNALPSVQPEIIRCEDCKWYGRADKRRFYRGMDCLQKRIDTIVPDKDFCSKAERRTDESD